MKHQLLALITITSLLFSCKKATVTTQPDKSQSLHTVLTLTPSGVGQIHNATMDYVFGEISNAANFSNMQQSQQYEFVISACVDYLSSEQDIQMSSADIYGVLENQGIDEGSLATFVATNMNDNVNDGLSLYQGHMHTALSNVFAAMGNANNINELENATETILTNNVALLSTGDYENLQYVVEVAKASWNHWVENDQLTEWHGVTHPNGPTLAPGKAKDVAKADTIAMLTGIFFGPAAAVIRAAIVSAIVAAN